MTDIFMLFLLFLSVLLILYMINAILAGSFICPYIKKNGRSTGRGANLGWAEITNASIADEISKKNGEKLWFLRLFWIIVFLEFGLTIGGVVVFVFLLDR